MLNFPKVIQLKQVGNKGLIKYRENAAYYNTTPSLPIKEGKKRAIHIYTRKQHLNISKETKLTLPL